MEIGYKRASEERGPNELVRFAGLAEEHGFGFALISDHFHPWIDRQGQSPFVWSVIGAIAHTTKRQRLGTAVTSPTVQEGTLAWHGRCLCERTRRTGS